MTDSNITRVYQFLTDFNAKNGDWKNVADKNGDGVIIKTEFRNFMLNNYEWNGEESNKNDIINNFWKNIDTVTSGKVKGHNKIKNKNALDSSELNKMDKTIQIYEIMNEFVKKNVNTADAGVNNKSQWLKSVKESLASHIEKYIKNGGSAENAEAFLAEKLPISKSMATANIYAQEFLKSEDIRKNFPEGYSGQGTMQDIISEFVKSLGNNEEFQAKSQEEKLSYIKTEVEKLVKAYMATADIGDGDPSVLAEYGYYTGGELNDIQTAYLTKTMGDKIQNYLETNYPDICTSDNKETIRSAVETYIQEKLKGASYDDFKSLKYYNAADIVDDSELITIINNLQSEYNELAEAKAELKLYCLELEGKQDESVNSAIKKVFGSMDYRTKIENCKTKDELQTLKEAIETEVAGLENKISNANLKDEKVKISLNETKSLSLPTTYTSVTGSTITTDKIEYRASGSHISIDGTKAVISGGTNSGTYVETIDIYINGEKQGSKKVTIEVISSTFDFAGMNDAKLTATITKDGNRDTQKIQTVNLAEAYAGNYVMELSDWDKSWSTVVSTAKRNLATLLDSIKNACISSGDYDTNALTKAYNQTKALYELIIDGYGGHAGKNSGETKGVNYNGETYTYEQSNWHRESTASDVNEIHQQGGQENVTGIKWGHSRAGDDSDMFYVNVRCVMDIFNKFYKAAIK